MDEIETRLNAPSWRSDTIPTDVSQQFEHRAILRRRRYHLNCFWERAAFQV